MQGVRTLMLRALIGAVTVLLISLLARSRNYVLAGLVPLFPTFALVSHYIVGTERSTADLRATVLFGVWALIPYGVYLGSLYFLIGRLKLVPALAGAVAAWCVVALMLVFLWQRSH